MPYSEVSITGYNANPPEDDGTQASSNEVAWSKHKTKLGDPLKTAIESTQTNITSVINTIETDVSALESATTAAALLTTIKTVDGTGSGLDADLLDGSEASAFLAAANNLSDVASASTAFTNIKQAATTGATGVAELATAAEMVTGTDTGRVPSVSVIVNHEGVAKAWGYVNSTGTIQDGFNVTSVSNDATGVYTVTLSVTMANALYSVAISPETKVRDASVNTKTTTTFKVEITNSDTSGDINDAFNFQVFGTLA